MNPWEIKVMQSRARVTASAAAVLAASSVLAAVPAGARAQTLAAPPSKETPAVLPLYPFAPGGAGGKAEGDAVDRAGGPLVLDAPPGQSRSAHLLPGSGRWDLTGYTRLVLEVRNPGDAPVRFRVRALNDGGNDWSRSAVNDGFVHAGQTKRFNVYLYQPGDARQKYEPLRRFTGMSGLPGGLLSHWHTIDVAGVRRLQIELFAAAGRAQRLEVLSAAASHPAVPQPLRTNPAAFFPFVDAYGQYAHADWPGKVTSDADLKRVAEREKADLKVHPGPRDWSRFGGWQGGPRLTATGAFRAEKWQGKWWLVDPDGYLFWSHGANSVGYGSARTNVTGRESYFAWLPPRTGAWAAVWGKARDGKTESVDLLSANLYRQHGADWQKTMASATHARLKSWGMNTIGNWSEGEISRMRRTPYTVAVHPWSPTVSEGAWDVFHPEFEANFRRGIEGAVKATADDPWNIGYFVDNELRWGGRPVDYMNTLWAGEGSPHAKAAFVAALRAKYPDVAAFNRAVKAGFPDWDAALKSRERIDLSGVRAEAEAFYARVCDRYFAVVKRALRDYAPKRLYLGCRMNVFNPVVVKAAAKYCDVLSFNLYRSDISGFRPFEEDKPLISTEFHFGALDRGALGTGLQPASDQQDRADKYRFYVSGALSNPYVVGTHWFAYCPQAITGRGDGENYETGLFNLVNDPYPELRAAVRDVGYRLYERRSSGGAAETGTISDRLVR